jgi:hypothetical protein
MKIVFFVNSLDNPFVDAWYDFLSLTGVKFVILAQVGSDNSEELPVRMRESVIRLTENMEWRKHVEDKLEGPPDVVIYWWGLLSVLRAEPRLAWPSSFVSVVVDTFPNASRKSTSYLESLMAINAIRFVDLFIVTSEEMKSDLQITFGRIVDSANFLIIKTPFTLKNHSNISTIQSANELNKPLELIYLGRSDYLFSDELRMRKDDTSKLLMNFKDAGATISLRESGNAILDLKLEDRGFRIYKSFSRDSMTNGKFTSFLDNFSGQLPVYNLANSTIVRRVSNSLSTRFAQGVCSSTPIIIQHQAKFAKEFVDEHETGLYLNEDADQTLSELVRLGPNLRKNWKRNHKLWASETHVNVFRIALEDLSPRPRR